MTAMYSQKMYLTPSNVSGASSTWMTAIAAMPITARRRAACSETGATVSAGEGRAVVTLMSSPGFGEPPRDRRRTPANLPGDLR
jgi:hypothetical protein